MDEKAIVDYIRQSFPNVQVQPNEADYFFLHIPDEMMPFATLITSDRHDNASNLDREGVFRLNIGVGRETFLKLFGTRPEPPEYPAFVKTGHDFTAMNNLFPHPHYGHLFWVSVVNPTDDLFEEQVKPLLAEAHREAAKRVAGSSRAKAQQASA
jgi:hypothetical protein